MSAPATPPSPQLFFDTINAFHRTAALKSAIDLDLFSAIARGHNTPAALASAAKITERGARILADYLAIIGFLTKAGEKYNLTADSAAFLDRQSPTYIGGAVEFLTSTHMRERFENLTQTLRSGGRELTEDANALAPDHEVWVRFARGMAGLSMMPAELLAQRVLATAPSPTAPMRVLDVAAGHGLYGIAVAKHNPNATIVASDWSNVLTVAQDFARRAGVQDRYEALAGSAFDVNWGSDYDVVLLTNFLHHFSPAENQTLLRKVHGALKPGGRAFALEFVPNDDRITPPVSASFALIMLAATPTGDAYTFAEYQPMFRAAGFSSADCSNLEPSMQQVIVATK
jgi:2-polyprenyl-3-methyl-5-hydroxy-6-metoxy-1,4-benzoquinol methylase